MSFKTAHLCAIFNGTADFFLYLHGITQREVVLVGREPAERLGYASRAEQPHPGIEFGHEFGKADAPPVPLMEELLLELAEEAPRPERCRRSCPCATCSSPARAARISRSAPASDSVRRGRCGPPGPRPAPVSRRPPRGSSSRAPRRDAPRSTRRRACRRSNRSRETGSTSRRRGS